MKKILLSFLCFFSVFAAFAQVPTISAFSPASGPVGTTVTITGTNFNTTPANNTVFFGATKATVSIASATSLTVTVPGGATYQPITIRNSANSLQAASAKPFLVTYSPSKATLTTADFNAKADFTTGSTAMSFPYAVAIGDFDGDGKPDLAAANQNNTSVSVYRNTATSGSITTSSFAAKIDFVTGSGPISLAIGDLDGDGKLDLVTANSNLSTISVLHNTSSSGSISFAAKVDFTTGSSPGGIVIGDLDGDGKPDLAVINAGADNLSVLRNTATPGSITTGSFASHVDFSTGAGGFPQGIAISDLDGDGKADLAIANFSSNNVSVFRNTATIGSITTGSLAGRVDFPIAAGSFPQALAIGDLDGDGKPDVAVANYGNDKMSILRNTAIPGSITTGSFAGKVDFSVGTSTNSFGIAINDLNGDGKPDVAVANFNSNTISILRNTATSGSITSGSFAGNVDIPTGAGTLPIAVALGDIDGDGMPDITVANNNTSNISVFQNNNPVPIVTNSAATAISGTGATLNGTVNDNGSATTVTFTYGTDPALAGGTTVTATTGANIAAGAGNTSVTRVLTGLNPITTYYFRITATNAAGTTNGSPILSFTTPKANQTITFAATDSKVYGTADYNPGATSATSGINAITYASSNPAVATIVSGNIHVVGVGSTTITASQAASAAYNAGTATQTLTITAKPVTVTADAKTKVYGSADPAFTYTVAPALVSGDSFTGSLTRNAGENVGSHTITQGSLALSANYTITYVSANLSITAKPVTVTADAKTKVYGAADPVFTYTAAPALLSGDSFTGSLSRNAGENVGSHTITQGSLANSNYTITYVSASLSITAKPVTVTADAKTKVYGAADPAFTYTVAPALVSGDSFTGSLTRNAGENVGSHTITQGSLSLNANYTLTYVSASLSITAKPVTVTADAKTKVYGAADPAFTYTVAPALVSGDSFTGSLTRNAGENVGSHTITQGSLSLNANYTLTYVSASLTITAKPVTVTADAKTKVYGDADPAFTYTFAPALVSGDSFTGSLTRNAGENVGSHTITQGSLALNANYTLTYVSASLSITAKPVTVTADAKTKVYGSADPAFTYTVAPALVSGDSFTGSLTRNAGENVGSHTIIQGSLANSNYTITYVSASLSITAKPVTVTADAKTKVYGAADPVFTYTAAPALLSGDSFTGSLSRNAGENVGSHTITQGSLANSNYTITYVSASLSITAKPVTVTADAKTKVYGAADPAFTYTVAPALVSGDSFTGSLTRNAGENVGSHTITQGSLSLNANYTLTYVSASLSITAKPVTVTADAKTKVYGAADPAFTYTVAPALVSGDSFTGSLTRNAGENVGSHTITQGSLSLNANYTLTYVSASLTITAKPVTVTADAKTKVYGDADPAFTYTFAPALVSGDSFTGSLTRNAGENVGSHTITQGSLALNANYTLTYVSASLSITAKPVTVTADAKTKVYGSADPAFTYTVAPALVSGDSFTGSLTRNAGENVGSHTIIQGSLANSNYTITYVSASLSITAKPVTVTADAKTKVYGAADPVFTYTAAPALLSGDSFTGSLSRNAGENVGSHTITQGSLANSNYTITYVSASLSITAKPVTVTADAKTKVYGAADPAFTYTVAPALVSGDSFTGSLSRNAGENVGSQTITQGSLANSNYTITYVSASLSITAKPVTVTADAKTKVYGAADPALTYAVAPTLVSGDSFTGSLSRNSGEVVGSYAINKNTLSLSANYTLTYVSANMSITAKPVTVTADAKTKVYGVADPALTYTVAPALVSGDSFTGSLSRTAGENVGSYAINKNTLSLSTNYTLTYVSANLSITAKPVTVTADAKTKVYGSADPAFTYTVAPALGSGDSFTGALTRNAGENVGSYAINQGTLALSANYTINYTSASLGITAKPVTVTADAKTKVYGSADPAFTYTVAPALVSGDSFTGSLSRTAGENVGSYAINKNTLALSSNYTLSYVSANLTITAKALTITADNKSRQQGVANPPLTASYTGFANGETNAMLTTQPALSTTATTASPQGNYPIVPAGAAAQNYSISYVNGILSVTPGNVTSISLAAAALYENRPAGTLAGTLSSTSDDPNATFTYTLVTGTGSTDNASFSISGNQVLTTASLDFETKSSYSIRVRSTTQFGLSLEQVFTISLLDVNETPTLSAVSNQTICFTGAAQTVALTGITAGPDAGQTVTLSATTPNQSLFSALNVTSGPNGTAVLTYTPASTSGGTAFITVTVTDTGGTANGGVNQTSQIFSVTINPLPAVNITSSKGSNEVSKGEIVVLSATGGTSYTWSNAAGIISGQNTASLTIQPTANTTYSVTVTNATGCSTTQSFAVVVLEDYKTIEAVNIMSPNGDGINDFWIVENIQFYPDNEVRVFDKAGRVVFGKKGYLNTWDATVNGSPLAEGTYYYAVDFGKGKPKIKGFITVIRQQ